MQKKMWLLLCVVLVMRSVLADTEFHEVSVIHPVAQEDSGYHAFFYAMRFLKRFDHANIGHQPVNKRVGDFQAAWAGKGTRGDGLKTTNHVLEDFVRESKEIMSFFRENTHDSHLSLDEINMVLLYGTPGALDFYAKSKQLIFAESEEEFKQKLQQSIGRKPMVGVVKIDGLWTALGIVDAAAKMHIISMGHKLGASKQGALKREVEAVAAQWRAASASHKAPSSGRSASSVRGTIPLSKEQNKLRGMIAKGAQQKDAAKILQQMELALRSAGTGLSGYKGLFEMLTNANYRYSKVAPLFKHLISSLAASKPDACKDLLRTTSRDENFNGATVIGFLCKQFVALQQMTTEKGVNEAQKIELFVCFDLILKLLDVDPELLVIEDASGEAPLDTVLLGFNSMFLLKIVDIAFQHKDKLEFISPDPLSVPTPGRRAWTRNQAPLLMFLQSLIYKDPKLLEHSQGKGRITLDGGPAGAKVVNLGLVENQTQFIFFKDVKKTYQLNFFARKLHLINFPLLIEKLASLVSTEALSDSSAIYEVESNDAIFKADGSLSAVDYLVFLLYAYGLDPANAPVPGVNPICDVTLKAIRNLMSRGLVQPLASLATTGYWSSSSTTDAANAQAVWEEMFKGVALFVPGSTADPAFNVGLVNSGNTCYQNATLQAIHKCTPLRELLMARLDRMPAPKNHCGSLLATLKALGRVGTSSKPVATNVFANFAWDYLGFPYQATADASELLVRLFGALQSERVMPNSTPDPREIARGRIDEDELAQAYGMETLQCFKCTVCNNVKRAEGKAFDNLLSLPIPELAPSQSHLTLQELLAAFVKGERMADDEPVECEKCPQANGGTARTVQDAFMEFSFQPQQQYMVLQLKRFKSRLTGNQVFNPNTNKDEPEIIVEKIHTPVIFDQSGIVDIADSQGRTHKFEVSAVVLHAGAADGVHYWTVTPQGIYNDSDATLDAGTAMQEVLTTGVHGSGEGYMYFLKRVASRPTQKSISTQKLAVAKKTAAGGGAPQPLLFAAPDLTILDLGTAADAKSLVDGMQAFYDKVKARADLASHADKLESQLKKALEKEKIISSCAGKKLGGRDSKNKAEAVKELTDRFNLFNRYINDNMMK